MASRCLTGSSAPISSAPLFAPFNVCGSGVLTARSASAPLRTSAREPRLAPAASKSASEIEALSPAPRSTATSAPRPMNFLTVSGMAAQRVSPAASFRTAIFTRLSQDQQDDESDDETRHGAIFQQPREARVVRHVDGDILRRRTGEDRLVFGHCYPFSDPSVEASITRPPPLPKPRSPRP